MRIPFWVPFAASAAIFLASAYPFHQLREPEPWGAPLNDSELIAAVRDYFDAYAEARVNCDIEPFWGRYPALATGMVREKGINTESVGIDHCLMKGMEFELERYEPMLVRLDGSAHLVRVHGIEWWHYRNDPTPGGGEFIKTLRLERIGGSYQVTHSDEVTIVEYHEGQH